MDRSVRIAHVRAVVMDSGARSLRSFGRNDDLPPGIAHDAQGPVFREPWEAQAFAMALALYDRGLSLGRNGRQSSPRRSSVPRRRAIPTRVRPITGIGS